MRSFLVLTLMLIVGTVNSLKYNYYSRGSSRRSLCKRIDQLEKKVISMEQPVHVHVSGQDQASLSADGTHVHLHVSMDRQNGVRAALKDEYYYASCKLEPNPSGSSSNVHGYIHMRQKPSSDLEIKVDISGFPHDGLYGFHVHEFANFENGCSSFGGHYNPLGKDHGGPMDTERHVGDWGNLQIGSGKPILMTDKLATLFGPDAIIGRGIVVHAGTDDLGKGGDEGSRTTGNAGPRLSCCAIGWSKGGGW